MIYARGLGISCAIFSWWVHHWRAQTQPTLKERERERERETDRQTDRQTETDRQTDRQTDRDRKTETETETETDRQTDRNRHRDRQGQKDRDSFIASRSNNRQKSAYVSAKDLQKDCVCCTCDTETDVADQTVISPIPVTLNPGQTVLALAVCSLPFHF